MRILWSIWIAGFLVFGVSAAAQEPTGPAAQQSAPAPTTRQAESNSNGKKRNLPGYVILGTVFNERALAYPNVRVQIRREAEKKYRWETYTNSRGEFAVRVPDGQAYEVLVKEKRYKEITMKVSAKAGDLQERLSIRLEPVNQEKGGEKK